MTEKENLQNGVINVDTNRDVAPLPAKSTKDLWSGAESFTAFNNLVAFEEYAKTFLGAGFGNHKDVKTIMACMVFARDKGLPIIDCLSHLVPINGKVGADGHLIKAMVQRERIIDETIEDYKPIYSYKFRDTTFSEEDVANNKEAFKIYPTLDALMSDHKASNIPSGITPVVKTGIIDYRTTIKFTRWLTMPNGEFYKKVEYGIFTYSEAVQAQLTEKDNWQKYPKDMLYWRAYARGARRVADDVLHGVYERYELLDTTNRTEDVEYIYQD